VHEGRGQTQRSGWQASKRKKATRAAALFDVSASRGVTDARSEQSSVARASAVFRASSVRLAEQSAFGAAARRLAGVSRSARWQESTGCREALRLTATEKALKAHEAYGRMWLETTATRVCRDQTAERVRNPGSGWRWGGNPACQRSAHLISSKGNEPREGVFDSCCEQPVPTSGWFRLVPSDGGFVARPHIVVMTGCSLPPMSVCAFGP
jgi:hypothetical protein